MTDGGKKGRLKTRFLFLLLQGVEDSGNDVPAMCARLGRSRQNIHYYLRRLSGWGAIERVRSYPVSEYRLTPVGRRIKEKIAHSDGASYWRCHALQLGSDLESTGKVDFNQIRAKRMRGGWRYVDERVRDSVGEWNVRVQSNGLMIVSCPERVTESPKAWREQLGKLAERVMRRYCESYGAALGVVREVRPMHKELIGSERFASLLGRVSLRDVYVDVSQRETPRLEETGDRLEALLDLPKVIEGRLVPALERVAERDEWLARNLETHERVLGEMSETLKAIREELGRR